MENQVKLERQEVLMGCAPHLRGFVVGAEPFQVNREGIITRIGVLHIKAEDGLTYMVDSRKVFKVPPRRGPSKRERLRLRERRFHYREPFNPPHRRDF